ncbi:hypothetical protein HYFRA_00007711 [Hymenoscyphus fraxineus]|uniref:T6SS Phospholipase effector Tle1-like catalytic domain-containing protein n=1 Tax=Hymenoscyphus fraxineus TaxID=746836 RepID=A0A9N9KM08_9HELO|nr:hypothetical protein HYFRA_00007711 [Hymenoscyphus fraxineus]
MEMDPSRLLPTFAPHQQTQGPKTLSKQENGSLRSLTRGIAQDDFAESRVTQRSQRKTIVLCFDGTGNKFHGNSSDSNILKIFRMLDRSSGRSFHYYQPGIGTYVDSSSLSSTGSWTRLKNWYMKAKDSAVGTSFDKHVVGGYKFLMQYYSEGDDIYMFGFSRGSYTARFLAEMLDWMGLITHGNEEMIQFAWRTFEKWKAMDDSNEHAMQARKKAYEFMVSFRETFSRPVRRIRYLGLFDTVNSVPRFENAMMSRRHMPYSAKSSAKVIRHAVSIDERRAKFRSDLISVEGRNMQETEAAKEKHHERKSSVWFHETNRYKPTKKAQQKPTRQPRQGGRTQRNESRASRYRSHSHSRSHSTAGNSIYRSVSPGTCSTKPSFDDSYDSSSGDEDDQDIQELWFPGGHADIGGGWALEEGETPLSHVPLVWIVREARKAGLEFDESKMKSLHCWDESIEGRGNIPIIELEGDKVGSSSSDEFSEKHGEFKQKLHRATSGKIHDCLMFDQGLSRMSVLNWKVMEWIPFRRMDLRDDGSWKPIRWPLPRGEVRDMPHHAKIHCSAIRRMKMDPNYRPGNLILGGGGVGVRVAPSSAGIGEWVIAGEEGDHIGECYVRQQKKRSITSEK